MDIINISKDLIFSKQIYAEMIQESRNAIKNARGIKKEKQTAELYGLFYNAFAGIIRSGILHRKKMGADGFPVITVNVNGKDFDCRENILRNILREEYEYLIHPYEDESESYVTIHEDKMTFKEKSEQECSIEDESNLKEKFGINDKIGNIVENIKEKKNIKKEEIFEYDPDYDHYYNDRLPNVLNELEFVPKDTALKLFSIFISICGIIGSLLFL